MFVLNGWSKLFSYVELKPSWVLEMQQIDYVRIENYKCLREFEFEPSRINVFVGRNNTGKSSVLEAIGLTISSLNDFKDSIENDLVSIAIRGEDNPLHGFKIRLPLKYLINVSSGKNKSEILLKKDDNCLRLCIEYFKDGYPESDVGFDFIEYIGDLAKKIARKIVKREYARYLRLYHLREKMKMENYEEILKKLEDAIESEMEKIFNKLINAEKVFFSTYLNDEILRAFCLFATGERHTFIKKLSAKPPMFFGTINVGGVYSISELYNRLVKTNRLSKALDELRINVEGFDDIRESEGELYCVYQNLREPIPLSFMGDGFIALVYATFIATLAENGVVILEEPETNMHPGYLDVLAEQIVKNKKVQFFISTHSLELVEYLIKHAKLNNCSDDLQFVRMYRIDGDIGYEILSCEDARFEIEEIKADLRGT